MASTDVEKIKERLGIADVVGSYIKLEKAGSSFKARCPFHNEKTPSFFVSPARSTYHCFGCDAGGDIFSFVEQFEGLDFSGALRVLALKAGVSLTRENRKERDLRSRLYDLLEEATLYFEQELSKNKDAAAYLSSRGLADKSLASFRVGYAPPGWSNLLEYLRGKGFSDTEIEQAGLIKKGERGKNYDRFRSRIMFPIADSSGRIIAFSGRIFGAEKDSSIEPAKYINSPETTLFSKSNVLYGFDRAKLGIHRLNCSIVVEGQMDLLLSHQAGFINTVALSGTALSSVHLTYLKRLSGNIVMAYDADISGITSSGKGAHQALALGMDVKVAALPEGVDPADLIKKSTDTWREVIKNAKHVIDFYLDYLGDSGLDQRAFKLQVHKVVLPYVARVQNKIDQAHFVEKVSARLGVPIESVWEELSKVKIGDEVESKAIQKIQEVPVMTRKHSIEQKLSGILLWQEELDRPLIDVSDLRNRFTKIAGKDQVAKLINSTKSREASLAAELEHSEYAELEENVEELLLHLEEECIKEVFSETIGELKRAEHNNREEEVARLLKECKVLSDRIATLSSKKYSVST